MGGDETSPACCGFNLLQGCWGSQGCGNRRVQPEVHESSKPEAFSHSHRLQTQQATNRPYLQKFNSDVGTLPQLEPPVIQVVVSNAKLHHQQSDSILPHIANKGLPNSYQTHQDERPKPSSQFPTRFGSSVENLYDSITTKGLSNKLEEKKLYEGQRLPMSPTEALRHFQGRLTEFEQEEIMDYSEIWFLGLETKKIEGSHGIPQNAGYDDEHGSYNNVKFHQGFEYTFLISMCLFSMIVFCFLCIEVNINVYIDVYIDVHSVYLFV
ncbi:unnamed protein product [Coregonus sp. 'balchen']|nr:unnamed protein product [Coregonus sp. 'balchen']